MVDFHSHLLSSEVRFNRVFDRLSLMFFAKKFGINKNELLKNGYDGYKRNLSKIIRESKFVNQSVIFGVDAKFDRFGNMIDKDKTVCASNSDVLDFYLQNKDIIIPFFSINPNRKNALHLVEKYHNLGFKGAKFLHSYWDIDLRKYKEYFKLLRDLEIPLIMHIGNESAVKSNKSLQGADELLIPLDFGVKVVAAHMGIYNSNPLLAFSKNPKTLVRIITMY